MSERLLDYTRNAVSLLGALLVTASAVLILVLFGAELLGMNQGPYVGILAFLVLPAFFVGGLLLIPFGAWRARRRARKAGAGAPAFPVLDFNQPRLRRGLVVFAGLTTLNVIILALATFKGVEVMDSVEFCGTACHTVMKPEYTAYQHSPHARVKCTECHIGPGAPWFVKSKLSGAWQLVAVTFDLYPRPIPTPVKNLRPARETCEVCHWPTQFVGERLKIFKHYTDDEQTVPSQNVLMMHIGGKGPQRMHGIHWHVDPSVSIRYLSDEKRLNIADVELTTVEGTRVYKAPADAAPLQGPTAWRTMDCLDCHNRPSHIYGTPEREIDAALASGALGTELPYIRREGLKALKGEYPDRATAKQRMTQALTDFYAKEHPEVAGAKQAQIAAAGEALTGIWEQHVFPEMKVAWGTYPSFLGHQESPGCFRCHDGQHATTEGKKIGKGCAQCHAVLATEEEMPEILEQLQIK